MTSAALRLQVFGPDALRWIFYRKGNINLTRLEKKRLDLLAKYVLEYYRSGKIIIHSHTDSQGAKSKNKTISRQRGNTVKNYLLNKGIPEKLLIVKAHGERKPIKSNRTSKGRAKNRRIEIELAS
jgi:outer membrane protein OmpA-like peptidoglycan-associated protein